MMLVRMIDEASHLSRKPRVLFILQGVHHLKLYENVLKACHEFEWICFLPGLPRDDAEINAYYTLYGVRFFSDRYAALAHFADIDAVVTTWGVPHRKHLPYLDFLALAYELGIPVFELQHGLFQIGLTYQEEAAVVGSRTGAATALAGARNFARNALTWSGKDGIGYPRAYGSACSDGPQAQPCKEQVAFLTNHHWAVLGEDERVNCYTIMRDTIAAFPAVDFVLLPHHGELKLKAFTSMMSDLNGIEARNFRIETARDKKSYDDLLATSNLLVGSLSTTILDCEISGTPTVVFRNPSQERLLSSFRKVVSFSTSTELQGIVEDVLYKGYRPELVTGSAEPFQPSRLVERLGTAIAGRRRPSMQKAVAAIARYCGPPLAS